MTINDLPQALKLYQDLSAQFGEAAVDAATADVPPDVRFLLRCLRQQPQSSELRRAEMIAAIADHWAASGATIETKISDRVLEALSRVPRERFVGREIVDFAYLPTPLNIGFEQTISHPLTVANLALAAEIPIGGKVLDVGTGCGYQAAILSKLAELVISIEIRSELAEVARQRLRDLDIHNVEVRVGDGCLGAPDAGPFDAIVIAAASPVAPPRLVEQLADKGRLVLPLGDPGADQHLMVMTLQPGELRCCSLGPDRFVPLMNTPLADHLSARRAITPCYGAYISRYDQCA